VLLPSLVDETGEEGTGTGRDISTMNATSTTTAAATKTRIANATAQGMRRGTGGSSRGVTVAPPA
jgi:hypothetical protein